MSRFQEIRTLLGMTQVEMAEVLGCTQSNVSFLDRGQTITPDVARKLIGAADALGTPLTFNQVYGAAALPTGAGRVVQRQTVRDWPLLIGELIGHGWTMVQIAARIGVRLSTVRALARGESIDAPHATGCALIELHASGERPPRAVVASKVA